MLIRTLSATHSSRLYALLASMKGLQPSINTKAWNASVVSIYHRSFENMVSDLRFKILCTSSCYHRQLSYRYHDIIQQSFMSYHVRKALSKTFVHKHRLYAHLVMSTCKTCVGIHVSRHIRKFKAVLNTLENRFIRCSFPRCKCMVISARTPPLCALHNDMAGHVLRNSLIRPCYDDVVRLERTYILPKNRKVHEHSLIKRYTEVTIRECLEHSDANAFHTHHLDGLA